MAYTIAEINTKIRFTTTLHVIEFSSKKIGKNRTVVCKCVCGNTKTIAISYLMAGKTKSCGCLYLASCTLSLQEINNRIKTTKLTALSFSGHKTTSSLNSFRTCLCLCACGKKTTVLVTNLTSGHTTSCGCNRKGILKPAKYTVNIPAIYNCWNHMISRCYNKTNCSYSSYGGKGVTVCKEWKYNYQIFLDWCLQNGWKKGLQLDKDIKGTGFLYSPENCLFVTPKVNCNNKKNCIMSIVDGEKISLKMRCEKLGFDVISYQMVVQRVTQLKWDIERAINTPIPRLVKLNQKST